MVSTAENSTEYCFEKIVYEWATKNMKGRHFLCISSENINASCVKFGLDR